MWHHPLAIALLTLGGPALAQPAIVQKVDDFETDDISAWQTSMSPDYYKGGTGQKGLQIVEDPDRGRVLSCDIQFVKDTESEPVFITRTLEPKPSKPDVVGVRFWAKLTEAALAPEAGFRVRLRTSDTDFTDYDVQEQLGKPFPAGEWVRVELDTGISPRVRNVWNSLFGTIREMTFRLDDIDEQNAHFALLLDDIELVVTQPQEESFTPTFKQRFKQDDVTRILLLRHRAAGYTNIEQAIADVDRTIRVDTFFYRGLHFEFFGFPETYEAVTQYDAIIMLDVDPYMMSYEQCAWIADAVASGVQLLVFGGPVTLTHAKGFKAPLRSVLPVTFETDARDIQANSAPEPQGAHPLNQGLDPRGLGRVSAMHALTPRPDAQVPWTAAGEPLLITGPIVRGRSTVVNTMAAVAQSPTGDFFTSDLSDDLLRKLVRFVLGRENAPAIVDLRLPPVTMVGGGEAAVRVAVAQGTAAPTLTVDGAAVRPTQTADGDYLFETTLAQSRASEEVHDFRLEVARAGGLADWRDFSVTVQNPLRLEAVWTRGKYTFAPGSPVELSALLSRRDVPDVAASSRTVVTYGGGDLPVSIDGFVDAWVQKPGTGEQIHDQLGPRDVKTEAHGGLLPSWTVTGLAQAGRSDSDLKISEDPAILSCTRRVSTEAEGVVTIVNDFEVTQDLKAGRLPLLISLPVRSYAGMAYTVEQEGTITEGILPVDPYRPRLFEGKGLKLTIATPDGPLVIEVLDPELRVWARDLRQYDMTTYRIEVEAPFPDNSDLAAGTRYTIPVRFQGPVPGAGTGVAGLPGDAEAYRYRATVVGEDGYRWEVPFLEGSRPPTLAGTLPDLASGKYSLELEALIGTGPVSTVAQDMYVVDPLDLTHFYPIMSIIGIDGDGNLLDEAGIRARVEDLLSHGFNTAAILGTGNFQSGIRNNKAALAGYSESYAQQRGMATTYEYSNFQLYNRDGITTPCVFSPEYWDALLQRLEWQIDVGNRTPRLICAKVTDEPHIGPKCLDGCEHCRAEFLKRYGIEYRSPEELGEDTYARWAMADFLGHYVSHAYSQSAQIAAQQANFDLLLTYMAMGLGYQRPLSTQQDALDWTRHVKWVDFDVYPYFYPVSQRLRMAQAGAAMTYMRDVSRARRVPWGFYVELDDRNWPFQKNPKEASAECAFTAVARGADYLNSFINTVSGTGTQSRPERWEAAGEAFSAIRRIGPMLKHMAAVPSSVALLFPNTHQAVSNNYTMPQYALAAIQGGFGSVDVSNEEVIVEQGRIDYPCLVLLGAETIHADLQPLLEQWLQDGGVLVCDKLPDKTHRGEQIRWGFAPEPQEQENLGSLSWSVAPVGTGKVAFVANDLDAELKQLIEAPEMAPAAVGEYRRALGDLLRRLGMKSPVHVEYSETAESVDMVEAGLRANGAGALLVVVNHQPEPAEVVLRVDRPELQWLVDTVEMTPVGFQRLANGGLSIRLTVPGRWARLIAGYGAEPARLTLNAPREVDRGQMLQYEVKLLDKTGATVPGGGLLEVDVTDARGRAISRYGGAFAPQDGIQTTTVAIPLNATTGQHTITVRAPQIGAQEQVSFRVR